MTIYTLLKEEDIHVITAPYALNVTGFEALAGGADNSNFVVHTQEGDYVLTVFEQLTMDDTVEKTRMLLMLEEYDFPTTRVVVPFKGEPVQVFHGKPVVMKRFIAGHVVRDLNKVMLHQVGAAMARLHQIPVPEFFSPRLPYGILHFSEVSGKNLDPRYEAWAADRFHRLGSKVPTELPRGLIHGDVFYNNILFQGDRLIAFIDFMEALPYFLVYDLAMGMVGLCDNHSTLDLDKVSALIEGYQNIRKLEEGEKSSLQYFAEYAATAVSGWRFWSFYFDKPNPARAENHLHMKNLAEKISNTPEAEFINAIFD